MRVLHVISDDDRRGAQVFAGDLHHSMLDLSHDSRLVALGPGSRGGAGAQVLGASRWDPRAMARLRVQMSWADVAVAHGSSAVLACALLGSAKRKWVVRQISETAFWVDRPSRVRRVRWYCSRADGVVALSESAAADLVQIVGVPRRDIRVIPNGVPASDFLNVKRTASTDANAAVRIACISALVAEKGVDVVIEAVSELPGTELLVIGDGPERERLEVLARSLCPGRVEFVGSVSNVPSRLCEVDAVALASKGGDSMPAVLIEAGLAGLPVVASAVGAIPDIVLDGRTGFVVDRGDHAGFRVALGRLVSDPGLRADFGEAARSHCRESFEIAAVAGIWIENLARISK